MSESPNKELGWSVQVSLDTHEIRAGETVTATLRLLLQTLRALSSTMCGV